MTDDRARVRILLAPSETKAPGGQEGAGWEAAEHAFPELDPDRRDLHATLLTTLGELGEEELSSVLDASGELAREARVQDLALAHAPLMPALERYRGVVFEHLDLPGLAPAVQEQLLSHTLVLCGCFGLLRGSDPVPAYRLPVGARLPGLGASLSTWWRPRLLPVLEREVAGCVVLDLLPSSYGALWGSARGRVVPGGIRVSPRIVRVRGGRESVVSVEAKAVRGALARSLGAVLAQSGLTEHVEELAGELEERVGAHLEAHPLPYGYVMEAWPDSGRSREVRISQG